MHLFVVRCYSVNFSRSNSANKNLIYTNTHKYAKNDIDFYMNYLDINHYLNNYLHRILKIFFALRDIDIEY